MNQINCSYCTNVFLRSSRQINEANKYGWSQYCSQECQSSSKNTQQYVRCSNNRCSKIFKRVKSHILATTYCSRSCAVVINNSKFPKNPAEIKYCVICMKEFISKKKYCSLACKFKGQEHSMEYIVQKIRSFHAENKRIPMKKEVGCSSAARRRFLSWNNAIRAAGFEPNPVRFARKYIVLDGHKCDSLAEMIIDDWLYKREVKHSRSVFYPSKRRLSADFVIGDYWIEFFGLYGAHKRYDELREEKLKIAKSKNLKLIGIYPRDLFPKNNLDKILHEGII